MPRNFNRKQKQSLFLIADGTCQICGESLKDDWEADHIKSYSKGGETELINGQALCRKCNRMKGSRPMRQLEPRAWQLGFSRTYESKDKKDFLMGVAPGAGKTIAALGKAKQYLDSDKIDLIIVVSPSENLTIQWAKEANDHFNIQLDPDWGGTVIRNGMHGISITYQGVITEEARGNLRRLCRNYRVFVIFDEIHHAGDGKSWGYSIKNAFENASRRLCLSGTPFRGDSYRIPFVEYDDNGISIADYNYHYGDAIKDGYCRSVAFPVMDGEIAWWDGAEEEFKESSSFDEELNDIDDAQRFLACLDPTQPFIFKMLEDADKKLDEIRRDDPGAGGLVVTMNTTHAGLVAKKIESITGIYPCVVHSRIPKASDEIELFKNSDNKWIVSVMMISEGIDIKRLRVGVYLTNKRTLLLFRQIIGRVVRKYKDDSDDLWSFFFVPKVRALKEMMETIKEEVSHALRPESENEIDRPKSEYEGTSEPGNGIQAISALPRPEGDILIFDEEIYEQHDVKYAMQLFAELGIKGDEVQATSLVRKLSTRHDPQATQPDAILPNKRTKPAYVRVGEFRKTTNKRAYEIACWIRKNYPTTLEAGEITTKIQWHWKSQPGHHGNSDAGLEELQEKMKWLNSIQSNVPLIVRFLR